MFNKLKCFILFILFLCCSFCYSQIKVATLSGPSSVPFAFFAEKIDSEQLQIPNYEKETEIKSEITTEIKNESIIEIEENSVKNSFNVEFCSSLEKLMNLLKTEQIDICAVPVVLLPDMLNYLDFAYSCIGVFETSSFYVLSSDKKVKKITDFLGKSINVYGNNSVGYNFLTWILTQNEIPLTTSAGGIFISVLNSRENIVSSLITKKNYSAILSEPDVSVVLRKNKSLNKIINLQKEYSAIKGNDFVLPVNVIIARKDFIKNNKESLLQFEEVFSNSISEMYKNPQKIQFLAKKFNLGIKDKVIIDGIKNMNFEYINSDYKDLVLESIQILNNKSYQLIKNKKDIFVSN